MPYGRCLVFALQCSQRHSDTVGRVDAPLQRLPVADSFLSRDLMGVTCQFATIVSKQYTHGSYEASFAAHVPLSKLKYMQIDHPM